MAIFISGVGLIDRYTLYQHQSDNSREVARMFCILKTYADSFIARNERSLTREDDRIRFTLELYYLPSALHAESEWGDTQEQVTELVIRITTIFETRTSRLRSPAILPAIIGKTNLDPMLVGRVTTVAQLKSSKPLDMKWCWTSLERTAALGN